MVSRNSIRSQARYSVLAVLILILSLASAAWSGTICSWDMDEGSGGKLADSSGKGFDGVFIADSGDGWVPGVKGKAVHLTGGSGCIQQALLLSDGLAEGTISFRVKFDRAGVEEIVLDKLNDETNNSEDRILIIKRPDNHIEYKAYMSGYGTGIISLSEVFPGEWTHIAVNWGPKGRQLYIDGTPEAEDTYPVAFGPGKLTPFTLGKGVSAAFDQVVVKDTSEEIKPLGNHAEVELVKIEHQVSYRQGDSAEVKLHCKIARPQKGRAKAVVALYKNDRTVIRRFVTFPVDGWKPGEIKHIGTVKFDLSDAPQGDNMLGVMGLATKFSNVPESGIVGSVKVQGCRLQEKGAASTSHAQR